MPARCCAELQAAGDQSVFVGMGLALTRPPHACRQAGHQASCALTGHRAVRRAVTVHRDDGQVARLRCRWQVWLGVCPLPEAAEPDTAGRDPTQQQQEDGQQDKPGKRGAGPTTGLTPGPLGACCWGHLWPSHPRQENGQDKRKPDDASPGPRPSSWPELGLRSCPPRPPAAGPVLAVSPGLATSGLGLTPRTPCPGLTAHSYSWTHSHVHRGLPQERGRGSGGRPGTSGGRPCQEPGAGAVRGWVRTHRGDRSCCRARRLLRTPAPSRGAGDSAGDSSAVQQGQGTVGERGGRGRIWWAWFQGEPLDPAPALRRGLHLPHVPQAAPTRLGWASAGTGRHLEQAGHRSGPLPRPRLRAGRRQAPSPPAPDLLVGGVAAAVRESQRHLWVQGCVRAGTHRGQTRPAGPEPSARRPTCGSSRSGSGSCRSPRAAAVPANMLDEDPPLYGGPAQRRPVRRPEAPPRAPPPSRHPMISASFRGRLATGSAPRLRVLPTGAPVHWKLRPCGAALRCPPCDPPLPCQAGPLGSWRGGRLVLGSGAEPVACLEVGLDVDPGALWESGDQGHL